MAILLLLEHTMKTVVQPASVLRQMSQSLIPAQYMYLFAATLAGVSRHISKLQIQREVTLAELLAITLATVLPCQVILLR